MKTNTIRLTKYHQRSLLRWMVFTCFFMLPIGAFAQEGSGEVKCSNDTVRISELHRMQRIYIRDVDSGEEILTQALFCYRRSNFGVRLEMGLSHFFYAPKTTLWLGEHFGPHFLFGASYKGFTLGIRFQPMTIQPQSVLAFNGIDLTSEAKLNRNMTIYQMGYSLNFNKLFSVEPFLGWNSTSFLVINEQDLQKQYAFSKANGLTLGLTLNKYFQVSEFGYMALFVTLGRGFLDFNQVHPSLERGYFDWTAGIAFKGFATKYFYRKV